ncbi:unnamed protein product [Porites lobata]|uniref:BRICHOS domain-containing protein n=1 Tax=Porites lobata TaxID=104759 RepID=A0ABN8SG78_9CNID|nr:unnamed protein product [Porites lobata]
MARLMLFLLLIAPSILTSNAESGQKAYTFRLSKDKYERIKVDANKNSETFSLRQASSGKNEGDYVYDFNKNLTMIRLPEVKACFLRYSIGNVPRPADLLKLLQLMQKSADSKVTTASEENFKAIGKLSDRSGLSDEMKDLCAELPIYRIRKINEKQNDADQMEDPIMGANDLTDVAKEGVKGYVRKRVCKRVCRDVPKCVNVPKVSCSWRGCKTSWHRNCWIVKTVCPLACTYVMVKAG